MILIGVIWHANSTLIFSQSIDYIKGKVFNSDTYEPVPFASVWLQNNQLGVIANAEADFRITNNPKFQEDSLIITCIGFKRYALSFKDLSSKGVNRIFLSPVIYNIDEVKVIAITANISSRTIIRRAIRKIRKNYPKKPYNYISYYRDYQKREGNYINLNEAIVQTLDNGFNSKSASNKHRLLEFKKNMNFPRMSISPYYDTIVYPNYNNPNKIIPNATLGDQYGNELFVLMVHDGIRNYRANSFSFIDTFSIDFLRNHDFSEPVPIYNDDLLLFRIDFTTSPRITLDSLFITGAIYIQPNDYSIHKLEYSCAYFTKEKEIKIIYSIDTEYGYENSVDSLLCLKYISFNNVFNVVDTTDNNYFKILDTYWKHSDDVLYPTMVLVFNRDVDTESARRKQNYKIVIGDESVGIESITVNGNRLFIILNNSISHELKNRFQVNMFNIKDIFGNHLNQRNYLEFYQYRELFVQEYNKPLPIEDSCYLQQLPLEQNCISKYTGNSKYWMNTPEKIRIDK